MFIEGVPPTTEATEAVARMLGKGKLQETHYGQFWDFEADMKHGDLVRFFSCALVRICFLRGGEIS